MYIIVRKIFTYTYSYELPYLARYCRHFTSVLGRQCKIYLDTTLVGAGLVCPSSESWWTCIEAIKYLCVDKEAHFVTATVHKPQMFLYPSLMMSDIFFLQC